MDCKLDSKKVKAIFSEIKEMSETQDLETLSLPNLEEVRANSKFTLDVDNSYGDTTVYTLGCGSSQHILSYGGSSSNVEDFFQNRLSNLEGLQMMVQDLAGYEKGTLPYDLYSQTASSLGKLVISNEKVEDFKLTAKKLEELACNLTPREGYVRDSLAFKFQDSIRDMHQTLEETVTTANFMLEKGPQYDMEFSQAIMQGSHFSPGKRVLTRPIALLKKNSSSEGLKEEVESPVLNWGNLTHEKEQYMNLFNSLDVVIALSPQPGEYYTNWSELKNALPGLKERYYLIGNLAGGWVNYPSSEKIQSEEGFSETCVDGHIEINWAPRKGN